MWWEEGSDVEVGVNEESLVVGRVRLEGVRGVEMSVGGVWGVKGGDSVGVDGEGTWRWDYC